MFRSLIFAIGIFLLILGAQTLVVDRWVLANDSPLTTAVNDPGYYNRSTFRPAGYSTYSGVTPQTFGPRRVYQTREWMPWSLLAAGTIIVLYTYSSGRGRRSDD